MALPIKNEIQNLNFSLDGSPFCSIGAKPGLNLNSLQFSFDGSPWWANSNEIAEQVCKIWLGSIPIHILFVGSKSVPKEFKGSNQI